MSLAVPDMLVGTQWLADHLADPDLRVFDCSVTLVPAGSGVRPESGRATWSEGHIPGSGFADLLDDLSDKSQALPIMMPPAAQFAAAMGRYGIGPTSASSICARAKSASRNANVRQGPILSSKKWSVIICLNACGDW